MEQKITPLVSIYITTKNRPEMLIRAINSVLAQTYNNIELLISDDGSTDDTPERVKMFTDKHHNIIYIRNEISQGACVARNLAINKATGIYITGLDDDDRFTKSRIQDFVNGYEEGVSFLCGLSYTFDGVRYKKSHYYNKKITAKDIFRRNYVGNQVFVKRSDLIENNVFFDEKYPAWQDYDFFTNLICTLGPAKRVYTRSYITHTDHEQGRITHPSRIKKGYRLYLSKYKRLMTKSARVSLAVNCSILSETPIKGILKKLCITHLNLWDLFRIYRHGK